MKNFLLRIVVVAASLVCASVAQEAKPNRGFGYPPSLPGTDVETYKEVDGAKLNVWIFQPGGKAAPGANRPSIVLFFGGGWSSGSAGISRSAASWQSRRTIAWPHASMCRL